MLIVILSSIIYINKDDMRIWSVEYFTTFYMNGSTTNAFGDDLTWNNYKIANMFIQLK